MTDHPCDYRSFMDDHYPGLQTCDGCNKLATDNVSAALLLHAREEMVIDMDLGVQQLKLSMMSSVMFGRRYQFVTKTSVNFSPYNRKSDIFHLGASGVTTPAGSVESGDGEALVNYLRDSGEGAAILDDMMKDDLDRLYVRYFRGKAGLSS